MSDDYEFTEGGMRFGVFRTIGDGEKIIPLKAERMYVGGDIGICFDYDENGNPRIISVADPGSFMSRCPRRSP